MEIIKVVPRGYCVGVIKAIQLALETAKAYPDQKIYMLGMVVHNRYVVEACTNAGILCLEDNGKTRLELLDEIEEGVVIFTAHGVSDAVYEKAKAKGLIVVDATCKDVKRTHDLVKEHCTHGDVIYIGKKNHPEAEGVIGLSNRVHFVSSKEEIEALGDLEDVCITNQTTLSSLDCASLIQACLKKYPGALVMKEICNATRMRQEAVLALKDVDCLIVVGDPRSNNSNQLKQLGAEVGIDEAYLIEDAMELKEEMVAGKERIAVTSGSSTPNGLTAQVIEVLENYAKTGIFVPASSVNSKIQ